VVTTTSAIGRVGDYIREQREAAAMSVRRLAQDAGVSNPYLSQVERGLRKPSAEVLQQIAKALRISAETLYVRAGLLEDHGGSEVEGAILGDPLLSERHKRALLDIYASFRAEAGARAATADQADAADPAATDPAATEPAASESAAPDLAEARSGDDAEAPASDRMPAGTTQTPRSARTTTKG
jgi:transcriptional regulator with XRE-family HTH domain